ncbi:hypothetical protein LCGC14_0454120 [marine sediment metagenome]|uniref:Uncharacterized protein n=1 Tax=marine sediment metagenome TaxID=412755 RepID=A0A0F9T047_9ZZZZ
MKKLRTLIVIQCDFMKINYDFWKGYIMGLLFFPLIVITKEILELF